MPDRQLNLFLDAQKRTTLPQIVIRKRPLKPTVAFDTYWKFAAERQRIFFRKLAGEQYLTDDNILQSYKFTNAYRASDRVSQYLIKHVIYEGDQSPKEIFFRTILFKTFNRIDTWKRLESRVGPIRWAEYDFTLFANALDADFALGKRIYSAAYIMASAKHRFGHQRKHRNHLKLIELMMDDHLPERLSSSASLETVFNLLLSYPSIGKFLAFQYTIDLNYGPIINFPESDYVVAGPGAIDGIRKCFTDRANYSFEDVIRWMADNQYQQFERLGINFADLWGRPLQLIDCQNLFCEVDKYARVAHPELSGASGRSRIKQRYAPHQSPLRVWYPPKWGLNERCCKG